MGVHENLSGAERTARYRAAKRAQGLRLRQIWVPDLRDPEVRAEIERCGAEIYRRDRADGTMDYLESLYDEAVGALPSGPSEEDSAA